MAADLLQALEGLDGGAMTEDTFMNMMGRELEQLNVSRYADIKIKPLPSQQGAFSQQGEMTTILFEQVVIPAKLNIEFEATRVTSGIGDFMHAVFGEDRKYVSAVE